MVCRCLNSKADADATAPKTKKMLGGAGEMMTAPPEASEGEVVWTL